MKDLIKTIRTEKAEDVAMAIIQEHPTNQQSFWRQMSKIIDLYASNEFVDLRNEGATEWAKKVNQLESYMPMV